MNYLVEHYKRFNKIPYEFKKNEPPSNKPNMKSSFKLPPKKALAVLKEKGKNIITTDAWDKIEANAYAKAFTVAKIMSADVVQEVFDYVQKAKQEGWTLRTFQKNVIEGGLLERMQEAGWTGKSASRLKVIYDTNMKIAAAKGKYDGMKLIADIKPYWVYKQVERKTKRHDHSLFHNKKFRHDDPIWATIFPPSAFGCSCYVVATADGSGVENGNDYLDRIDSKDYQLKPLKQFEPDKSKYHDKIKAQLEKLLGKRGKKEPKSFDFSPIKSLLSKSESLLESINFADNKDIINNVKSILAIAHSLLESSYTSIQKNELSTWNVLNNWYLELLERLNKITSKNIMSDDYKKLFDNPEYNIAVKNRETIEEYGAVLFDRDVTLEELAKMTGAPTGSKMFFQTDYQFEFKGKSYNGLSVDIDHTDFRLYRRIFYERDGKVCVHNDYFKPKKPNDLPKGIGAMALYKQIEELREYGIETIDTWAYGNYERKDNWTGYYVWPELGFNAKIPTDFVDKLKSLSIRRELIDIVSNSSSTLHDVMNNNDLKDLWSRHGDSVFCEFDIKDKSSDYLFFIDVLKRKGIIKN